MQTDPDCRKIQPRAPKQWKRTRPFKERFVSGFQRENLEGHYTWYQLRIINNDSIFAQRLHHPVAPVNVLKIPCSCTRHSVTTRESAKGPSVWSIKLHVRKPMNSVLLKSPE